jgi:endonuclease/exonuclease/phosphatase family metal-dependent hydrolase
MCWRTAVFACVLSTMAVPGPADTIKVMTFNLRTSSINDGSNNWVNANQIPDRRAVALMAITNRMPDIVGLQEGRDDQLNYLAANMPASYAWQRQHPSGGHGGDENAAFAYNTNALQLIDCGVFSLGTKPGGGYWNNKSGTPFDPWSFFPEVEYQFPRLASWGWFKWMATGQEFLCYTTHFDVFNATYDGQSQVKSAAMMVDDARQRNNPVPVSLPAICGGDFNSSQNNRAWQLFTGAYSYNGITGDFTDSWWQAHGTWINSGTFHGFNGGVISGDSRIDWVLHRGGFVALSCEIVTDAVVATVLSPAGTRLQYPSDHYPVCAVLQLPAPVVESNPGSLFDVVDGGRFESSIGGSR